MLFFSSFPSPQLISTSVICSWNSNPYLCTSIFQWTLDWFHLLCSLKTGHPEMAVRALCLLNYFDVKIVIPFSETSYLPLSLISSKSSRALYTTNSGQIIVLQIILEYLAMLSVLWKCKLFQLFNHFEIGSIVCIDVIPFTSMVRYISLDNHCFDSKRVKQFVHNTYCKQKMKWYCICHISLKFSVTCNAKTDNMFINRLSMTIPLEKEMKNMHSI